MTQQRNALVTGASRGIGAAIAQRLAEDGIFVFGTATTPEGAAQVSDSLGDCGSGILLQLPEENSIRSALDAVEATDRTIDILVNNAGITRDNIFLRMSGDAWNDVIETNLTGLFRITKPLLRSMMRNRWGRIVNMGSVVASTGNPGQVNYSAAKAGIEGFTRSLAIEVASRGITVNCVAPGMIATDMTADLPDSVTSDLLSRIPLGRLGQAWDVACAVSFLVSDQASYITAQTMHVNGGMLAT
ncbi:MAG: 3-oxoacyl-[acyl-carrier-protein] reductase [Gammaproteobacteria bacterium]|nr:3-oxoacyl-[acyl-carrier-protein] reductase [Gammaproteobacteria bacterium]